MMMMIIIVVVVQLQQSEKIYQRCKGVLIFFMKHGVVSISIEQGASRGFSATADLFLVNVGGFVVIACQNAMCS